MGWERVVVCVVAKAASLCSLLNSSLGVWALMAGLQALITCNKNVEIKAQMPSDGLDDRALGHQSRVTKMWPSRPKRQETNLTKSTERLRVAKRHAITAPR